MLKVVSGSILLSRRASKIAPISLTWETLDAGMQYVASSPSEIEETITCDIVSVSHYKPIVSSYLTVRQCVQNIRSILHWNSSNDRPLTGGLGRHIYKHCSKKACPASHGQCGGNRGGIQQFGAAAKKLRIGSSSSWHSDRRCFLMTSV
mmetsp:Transcript_18374/g.60346  ORF Transcript_18374/g.60346 Transcript_18374/m.60346 type:complete len:149 (-) Transcript_18374:547-993(-)